KGSLTSNIVSYIPYVGNAATSLIVLNYSRSMEKQADTFGTRILVNSGYAADGVRNLMAKLAESQDEDNPEPPAWLSTHPNSRQRIDYIEQLVVEKNLDRYAYEGVYQHQPIKQLVTEKWQQYEKCIEEIETLQEAKVCAGEEPKTESKSEKDIQLEKVEEVKSESETEIR
ncbi:MAG: M48 family metalloprotease, partial [Cyanobacteria bacterium J06600_6]